MGKVPGDDRMARIQELESRLAEPDSATGRIDVMNELSTALAPSDARRAQDLATEALELAREQGYDAGEAFALQSLANACWARGSFDDAISHARDALGRFEKLQDAEAEGRTHMVLGSIYLRQSRLADAMKSTLAALRLSESAGDRQGVAIAHNTLGVIYSQHRQFDKSLEHRLESARIHEEIGDHYRLSMAYINIGNTHWHSDDFDRALEYYNKGIVILENAEPVGFPIASAYQNVGEIHQARAEYDRARSYYEKALSIQQQCGDGSGIVSSCVALGHLHLELKDLPAAEELLKPAIEKAREIGLPRDERQACLGLSQVNESRGDFQEALRLQKLASELQEKILDDKNAAHLAEMQTKYDTERKEREAEIYQLRYVELEQEVSRRRNAERALIQSQKLESLGLMAGGVAHDFNNMLLCVLGYLEMARDLLPKEHDAVELIDLVGESSRRAAELAQQMLAYAGRRRYEMKLCDLNAILGSNRKLLQGTVGSNTELLLTLDREMPSIKAEASQVHQIVMNLVLNASEAGATSVQITTQLREVGEEDSHYWEYTGEPIEPGAYVALVVSDDGHGMTRDVRSNIFDPFYSTKFPGRGLGLAAVLGIIRGHSGAVMVRSEVGDGTTFEFLFPVVEGAGSAAGSTAESSGAAVGPDVDSEERDQRSRPEHDRTGTVLVIDDESNVRQLVSSILRSAGHEVLIADNGQAGIELFRRDAEKIDVILLDMTMPGIDVSRIWQGLRDVRADVEIVLTSGYDKRQILAGFPEGVEFIGKPYRPGSLLEVIGRLLGRERVDKL